MLQKAQRYLNTMLGGQVSFRVGQWESIENLLNKKRVLVVQRTGWGKSIVYFIATKLLREQGEGPSLLISPLLSLMRNQITTTENIGIRARKINSENHDEWPSIKLELSQNKVDILMTTPEQLANDEFIKCFFPDDQAISLLVIDEAHCISDWGHDFRPDYQRIKRILNNLPPNIPVIATTATANLRVTEDIKQQLGNDIEVKRGTLTRKSLKLYNINMPKRTARMAWLAKNIPLLAGSGIVYTLTQRDADMVAEWLQEQQIEAFAYHAGISETSDNQKNTNIRKYLEEKLLNNEIKVLVATIALGMGFDKPDLGFVIHFQRPASVVHYYQQIGRAGRQMEEAFAILLCGEEDDRISNYFIENAFPSQQHISKIIETLKDSEGGLSVPDIQKKLNLPKNKIEKLLKFMNAQSPAPIIKIDSKWQLTSKGEGYKINEEHVASITRIRYGEQAEMKNYMGHSGCLMRFLQSALDDTPNADCGKCNNCAPNGILGINYDEALLKRAKIFLQKNYHVIKPRKKWPSKEIFEQYNFLKAKIPQEQQAQEGRALSLWQDGEWGDIVKNGKYNDGIFSDDLVEACVKMFNTWNPSPTPKWVTCVPSLKHPKIVPNFAKRLALALEIPFIPCIENTSKNREQKKQENDFHKVKNLDGVFNVTESCEKDPCLLIDDIVDSRWTFTITAALLRQKGCAAVYPLALALNSPRID